MNFEQGSGMQNFSFRVTIPDIGTIFCLAVSGIDSDV